MQNLKIFCLTMRPSDLNLIEKLGYIPVGLGNENFSENFFRDNTLDHISEKIDSMENILFTIGSGRTT